MIIFYITLALVFFGGCIKDNNIGRVLLALGILLVLFLLVLKAW